VVVLGKCRPDRVVFDEFRGELICSETGEVLQDHLIDYGPEWRSFSAGERSRSGLIPLRNERRGVREVAEVPYYIARVHTQTSIIMFTTITTLSMSQRLLKQGI